jgi:serine/threonine-protein kinase RsbW
LSVAEEIAVRLLVSEEAPLLVQLIRNCYGDTYIDPKFYDEQVVSDLLRSARLHSIGAFDENGRLVGHMGISLRPQPGITADAGMTLVDPEFRGRRIALRVAAGLAKQSMALGLIGVHDYPVTVHAATQRIGAGFGVDTGLMLANLPGDVRFEEMETPAPGERTSSLIRWLPFGLAPERSVYLPDRHRLQIEALYAAAFLSRSTQAGTTHLEEVPSELERSYDARRQTLRIAVVRAGDDLVERLDSERRQAVELGGLIAHVDLPLGQPTTPVASEALREIAFSFAGVLPEYRDGDVLRLQWLADSVDEGAFSVLASDSSRALQAFVLADRASLPD